MIQFNLLPDVKLEFVRAERTKHAVLMGSMMAAGSAFMIFLLLFLAVNVAQRKNMNDLNKDIASYSKQLRQTPDLNKILTIQGQLKALPALHAQKPAATRTFVFMQQLVPQNVSLTDLTTDYAEGTMTIMGESGSLDTVNKFVDTLKFTKYTAAGGSELDNAFSGVVLSQFTRNASGSTFTITTKFAPEIFDNAEAVSLNVPNRISTPSVVGQPQTVFQKPNAEGSR